MLTGNGLPALRPGIAFSSGNDRIIIRLYTVNILQGGDYEAEK
jgi:hypothetical protein